MYIFISFASDKQGCQVLCSASKNLAKLVWLWPQRGKGNKYVHWTPGDDSLSCGYGHSQASLARFMEALQKPDNLAYRRDTSRKPLFWIEVGRQATERHQHPHFSAFKMLTIKQRPGFEQWNQVEVEGFIPPLLFSCITWGKLKLHEPAISSCSYETRWWNLSVWVISVSRSPESQNLKFMGLEGEA